MTQLGNHIYKRIISVLLTVAVVLAFPMHIALADDVEETSITDTVQSQAAAEPVVPPVVESEVTPVTDPIVQPSEQQGPTNPGPVSPTGADANTYTQNPDGSWENAHFIWDPVTHQSHPKDVPSYFYDPATGTWSTNDWTYDSASGRYMPAPKPLPVSIAAALGLLPSGQRIGSIANTGIGSNNQINQNDVAHGIYNGYTSSEIANFFNMNSITGNALVNANTTAGGAYSGDSTVMASIVNMLYSAWHATGGKLSTFMQNLFGDVNSDILLDTGAASTPNKTKTGGNNSSISNTGTDSNNQIGSNQDNDVMVNQTNLNNITNNLNLNATTGDVSVDGNTDAGEAKSGNATVLLNLINLIHSAITSNQSFFGILNIFGNLNGDILFPENFLNSVLATGGSGGISGNTSNINNTGANSNNTISEDKSASELDNLTNIDTITNNVTSNAKSGTADVSNNTTAGDAKSGNVKNTLSILNLTGHKVVAQNAILVFVNVFGQWVGLIMDAPKGTTSALLAGGVESTGSNNSTVAGDVTINTTNENNITNNLNLTASTGNASVTNNTKAGSATTGDARIGGGIANIIDTTLSLGNWFGVLFVNVFGNWTGSLGKNTAAGTNIESGANPTGYSQPAALVGQTLKAPILGIASAVSTATGNTSDTSMYSNMASSAHDIDLNQLSDNKQPGIVPWANYAMPLFAVMSLLIASVLYKFGKDK